MISRKNVAHRVGPAGFARETYRRTTTRETTVRILVLTEVGVVRRDPHVGDKKQLMRHVPCVAVDRDDQRLGETWHLLAERVDQPVAHRRSARTGDCFETVDVDTARKIRPVSEQHCCTK